MKPRQIPLGPQYRHRRRRRSGVTLIDLLLVIVIAGILAVVGIPSMVSSLIDFRLSTTATRVVAAMEYAQATAVANGCPTRVLFDVPGNEVAVQIATAGSDLAAVGTTELISADVEAATFARIENPLNRGTEYVFGLADLGWSGNVRIAAADLGGFTHLEFDARGTPAHGGTVTLENDGRTLVLTVDAQSGKVTMP